MRRRAHGPTTLREPPRHRSRAACPKSSRPGRSSARRRRKRRATSACPPGVPVVAGAGDTAASALGAGIVRPGMLLDVAGTASVLAGCTDRFVADVENRTLLVMRSVVPGLWHPLAYIGGGGLALRWFRDQFGGRHRRARSRMALYDALVDEALAMRPEPTGSSSLRISADASARRTRRAAAYGAASRGATPARISSARSSKASPSSTLPISPMLESLVPGPRARRGARGRRRRKKRRLESDQGGRPGRALPAPAARRHRHLGERNRRRPRRRPDPGHGGGGGARIGAVRGADHAIARREAPLIDDIVGTYIEWQRNWVANEPRDRNRCASV